MAELYNLFLKSTGISTDTRKIGKDNIFFALKGPNFNANTFAAKAIEMGASYVVVDEDSAVVNDKCIKVDDVLTTLQQLATYHRQQLKIPVIAIGGSNGKTTTKELCGAVLATQKNIFYTKGNLNNHIGVPLSLLSITKETEIAVLELGANHVGETALLCEIAQPDFGLVTNNGKDHLEGYGSMEGVRKGNGELYDYLRKAGGTAFVSEQQDDLMEMSKGMKRITYGGSGAEVEGEIVSSSPLLTISYINSNLFYSNIETKLVGEYNFENIMAAIAIGRKFNITDENMVQSLSDYAPSNNRSQWIERNGNNFIVDCYNANPSSMELAINNFAKMQLQKKMIVAGDMFELGTYSAEEHKRMLQLMAANKIDNIILVGKDFTKANETLHTSKNTFATIEDLRTWFHAQNFKGYTVLLKASRGMTLEKLLA